METYKLPNNRILKIVQSETNESPREWDNLSQMIFTGKHSHLGDKHNVSFEGGFSDRFDFIERGAEMVKQQIKDVAIIKPVHAYIHSGMTISTSMEYPYNDRWDSGTLGFVIVTKQAIRENWGIKRVTQKYIDHAERILEGEIKILDQYVRGEVYGFEIVKVEECDKGCKHEEHEDSCYGFYGDNIEENGILDYLSDEDKEAVLEAITEKV